MQSIVRQNKSVTILDNVTANSVSSEFNVKSFRNLVIEMGTANSAALTVKVRGTVSGADLSAAATQTNRWSYIQTVDRDSGTAAAGSTGISWSGTDSVKAMAINIDKADTIAVEVSGYTAGNISGTLRAVDNA